MQINDPVHCGSSLKAISDSAAIRCVMSGKLPLKAYRCAQVIGLNHDLYFRLAKTYISVTQYLLQVRCILLSDYI